MERLQTAWEWNKELYDDSITIMDPDGWRRNEGVTMDVPITQEDFQERLSHCTCVGFIDNPKFQAANEKQTDAAKKRRVPKNKRVLKPQKKMVDNPDETE